WLFENVHWWFSKLAEYDDVECAGRQRDAVRGCQRDGEAARRLTGDVDHRGLAGIHGDGIVAADTSQRPSRRIWDLAQNSGILQDAGRVGHTDSDRDGAARAIARGVGDGA